jgi:hypothetical protein
MIVALFATIWLALVALVLSELGRRQSRHTRVATSWPIALSGLGVALATAHTLLALGAIYDWDHARAATVTAARAADIYGIAWAGSLYVNYLFLTWWLADTLWWWRSPATFLDRSGLLEWAWRFTAFTMVVNGAIIFASPAGRIAGIPLTVALLFVWGNPGGRGSARGGPRFP